MNISQASLQTAPGKTRAGLPARLWQYQQERFPVFAHGLLIAAFSCSGVCLSTILRGSDHLPGVATLLVAFFCSLAFFFQLRVADEYKDAADDRAHRPYRPVPRGLVTLNELFAVAAGTALMQLGLVLILQPYLVPLLVAAWAYLALMTREFFAADWLRRHPIAYMCSHMMILPIIDCFITACDWLPGKPPSGLLWFLAVSFFNGLVIEIGRKLRGPGQEEAGVETYSALWGLRTGAGVLIAMMALTAGFATVTASHYSTGTMTAVILGALVIVNSFVAIKLVEKLPKDTSDKFEKLAGLWTLVLYLSIGSVPMLLKTVF